MTQKNTRFLQFFVAIVLWWIAFIPALDLFLDCGLGGRLCSPLKSFIAENIFLLPFLLAWGGIILADWKHKTAKSILYSGIGMAVGFFLVKSGPFFIQSSIPNILSIIGHHKGALKHQDVRT